MIGVSWMGYVRDRGFTFVELLVALAVLAILVVIAWGKFNRSYDEALETTMISDLRNLATAQELYYRNHLTYSNTVDQLDIQPSPSSQISITSANPTGWSAWSQMERTLARCEVYVGDGHSAPLGIAESPEQITCGKS